METPAGEFYIDDSADKFLLIAAGSGITPMISMLRYLYDNKKAVDVFLYYQCRTREDIAFKLELEHLQTANPNLKVIIALSQPDALWGEKRRCLDTHTLKGIPEIIERQVFVCGPDEFMKNAQRQLLLLGLPESQYHQEAFGLAAIPPSVFTPITLTINGTAFAGHNQQPLLMQAEQTGVSLPYGCRAGFCGQCKVRLVSGRVDQQSSSALSSEEQQSNYVLACCSIPLTDVEVVSEGLGS
ncbi:flavin reductase family protein [Serratia fonticola]